MLIIFALIFVLNFIKVRTNRTEIDLFREESIQNLLDKNYIQKYDINISICSSVSSRNVYESLPSINETKTNSLPHTTLFCENGKTIKEYYIEEVNILKNGSISFISTGTVFDNNKYCMEKSINNNISYWVANICVAIVKMPRCCFMDINWRSRCDDEVITFDPPIKMNNLTAVIDDRKEFKYNLDCGDIVTVSMYDTTQFEILDNKLAFVDNESKSTINFCIDKDIDYLIKLCDPKKNDRNFSQCQGETCLRKCCPNFQIFDYHKNSCVIADRNYLWHPTLFDSSNLDEPVVFENLTFLQGFPNCKLMPLRPNDQYFALTNGKLFVEKYMDYYPNDRYCIDHFKSGQKIIESVLLCFPDKNTEEGIKDCKNVHMRLYPSFMIVSCIFLSLTILVYSILPQLNTKINGKCIIASTSTLIGAFVCLICIQWVSTKIKPLSCQALGLLTQFFSLSSIFWLNVMCFDVWRSLRSQHSIAGRSANSLKLRFIKYSIYAWGCPMIISSVTALMQFNYQIQNMGNRLVTPGFGKTGCFFPNNDQKPFWTYFYGFILVLMIVNTFFFVHLLILLHRERNANDSALHRKDRRHVMWMKLYLKLFGIMGITFIFEILSWIGGSCKLWIWTDSINALRGLLIFGIFVCKKDIYKKLRNRSLRSKSIFKMFLTGQSSSGQKHDSTKTNSAFYVSFETRKCSSV